MRSLSLLTCACLSVCLSQIYEDDICTTSASSARIRAFFILPHLALGARTPLGMYNCFQEVLSLDTFRGNFRTQNRVKLGKPSQPLQTPPPLLGWEFFKSWEWF